MIKSVVAVTVLLPFLTPHCPINQILKDFKYWLNLVFAHFATILEIDIKTDIVLKLFGFDGLKIGITLGDLLSIRNRPN